MYLRIHLCYKNYCLWLIYTCIVLICSYTHYESKFSNVFVFFLLWWIEGLTVCVSWEILKGHYNLYRKSIEILFDILEDQLANFAKHTILRLSSTNMQYADEHYTGCYISTQEEYSELEWVNVFIYATYTAVL